MEVRKELSKLEISCIDMASLLRSLGIPVGGGSYPLSNEVSEIGISIVILSESSEVFD